MAEQNNGDGDGESSSASCSCATCPQNITILFEGGEFRRYLEYHVANYRILRPNINIQLDEMTSSSSTPAASAEISTSESLVAQLNLNESAFDKNMTSSSSTSWDGIIFPAHWTGALIESNRLWDMTGYVEEQLNLPPPSSHSQYGLESSLQLDWPNIQPFVRSQQATFDGKVRLIPLDGDVLLLYYRRDLFEKYQIPIPRTWEEYADAATFFHGKPWGPNETALNGSCISRVDDCANYYWTSLVLSSMTQSIGMSSGYLLNPLTMDSLLGEAMDETLRIMADQSKVGPDDELTDAGCMQVNFDLNDGSCAMTYNWGNQVTGRTNNLEGQPEIGVAPTPGSTRVLNRDTLLLEDCTPDLCPFGSFYDDIGIVNRAPYSAFGGWQGGVSDSSPRGRQYATADFLAYMSNQAQSLPNDVLPNPRSSFADPYRYSHVDASSWVDAGLGDVTALQYTDSIGVINSQNTAIDFRISPGADFRKIMNEEVYSYLTNTTTRTVEDDALLRNQVTNRMDERLQQAISLAGRTTVAKMYQASLGGTNTTTDSMSGIDPKYRSAGWGVGGLICCTSLALIIWTLWHRRNRVMQAFQPYLLIQAAVGLFFMGGTIIPLGLDDTIVSDGVLDATCMATPWIYVVGFSLYFSSVYSKIKVCMEIFHAPEKLDVIMVRPMDALKGCIRVLLLNGIILFLWTLIDPLKWVRSEVTDGVTYSDGTVETYGACRGENFNILGFALALFFFNLILCLIGTLQAFKCRFLVLEYNEMQWLPLSLFPFFESWVVGCPILFFVREDPTTTFVVLAIVIAASSIAGTLAVFAPKDWYIRKFRGLDGKGSKASPRTSTAGVLVLKHPTVSHENLR
jgi:ABC-type glycerol-3-phosphate transport system substrate-binding protein